MKAEHRKELETNILADRMGRVLSTTKETPTTTIWYAVVAVCLVLLAAFLVNRWFIVSAERAATAWGYFEGGDQQKILELAQKNATQNVGKAARFQIAFEKLWVFGISRLGANPAEAKSNIADAHDDYTNLAKDCQNDPDFLAEALYNLAVIEETGAIDDPENLKSAVSAYKRVTDKAKDTAFAELARRRLEVLDVPAAVDGEDMKTREERQAREAKLADIRDMYSHLKKAFTTRGMPGFPGLPPMNDAERKKFLDELLAKHPEIPRVPIDVKPPEIKAPDVKAPEGKVPETKSPESKTPASKAPAEKGPDGKTKPPDIAPPPPSGPIPDAPGVKAPDPKTPAAPPPNEKKSDKK